MNREGIIFTVIITFVFSFVFVAILAVSNEFTAQRVQRNRLLTERRSVLNAFGIKMKGTDEDFNLYENYVQAETIESDQLYTAEVAGEEARAIRFSGSGLWGTITGVIATRKDFSRVLGMDIISHNETPGLGGRIDEPWFKEQFRSEKLSEGRIRVSGVGGGDTDHDNGRVDAVTGASRTSQALEQMLNTYLEKLQSLKGVQ